MVFTPRIVYAYTPLHSTRGVRIDDHIAVIYTTEHQPRITVALEADHQYFANAKSDYGLCKCQVLFLELVLQIPLPRKARLIRHIPCSTRLAVAHEFKEGNLGFTPA